MRVFQRLVTREDRANDSNWQIGHTFVAYDVSDLLACERGDDGDLGRMHLRSACKELKRDDDEFIAAVSKEIQRKFPKISKKVSEAA